MTNRLLLTIMVFMGAFLLPTSPVDAQEVIYVEPQCRADQVQVEMFCYNKGQPKSFSTIAMVWHPEASDVWVAMNYDDLYSEDGGAFEACRALMGEGCSVAVKGQNLAVAVGRANGYLYQGSARRIESARKRLAEICKKDNVACPIVREFAPKAPKEWRNYSTEYHFPTDSITPPNKRLYSAVYWSENPNSTGHFYVATGKPAYIAPSWAVKKPGEATAEHLAEMRMCQPTEGEYCFGKYSGNVNIIMLFRDTAGKNGAVGGADEDDVVRQANAVCMKRTQAKCPSAVMIDAREPASKVIDLAVMHNVSPEAARAKFKRWVDPVTGGRP